VHYVVYGAHQSGRKIKVKIENMGFYWPTTMRDCIEYA